ncbi:hypothetical protein ACFRMN_29850 [Streptomyces sp. NPDC056835]|uniref:hypothetical protein n=1 Tax=Streptomyces sp. NPDC056835 TaxID=3345956 RepID=UPI00368D75C3
MREESLELRVTYRPIPQDSEGPVDDEREELFAFPAGLCAQRTDPDGRDHLVAPPVEYLKAAIRERHGYDAVVLWAHPPGQFG